MKKKLTTADFIRRRAKGSPEEGETKDSALPEGLQKERKEQEEARRLLNNLIASGALPDASLGPLSFDLISKGKELEQSEGRVGLNVNGVMPFVDVSREGDLAEYGVKYAGGDPSQVYELMLSQRAPLKTPEGEIRMPVVGQGSYSRPFAGGQLSAQGYYVPRQEGMPKSQYGGNVMYTRRFEKGGEVDVVGMAEKDMPSRSEQALRAYIEAANPRINIKKEPLRPGVAGAVRSRNPDQILLNSMMKQTPAKTEETVFHELEHSLDERGANPLGVISKSDGNPITTDNNYRFDILYNKGDKKIQDPDMKDLMDLSRAGDGKKNRLMMIHSFVKNQPLIEKFFGRSLDSAYFNPNMLKAQARYGTEGALFAEQIADLSALEQITGKSLTRDKEMRKLLFPDDRSAEVYDAITGYRQTRLDSKDLPPYTPISPEKKGMTNWLKDKLGMKEGGEVSGTSEDDYIQQMMTGTPMSDRTPQRGLIPREIREAVDVPLDFLNLGIRGMAGAVVGPAYGLYQGITSEKFGTPEGVQEAGSEAGKMMQRITGTPKTETGRDVMEFIGKQAEALKLAPTPQLLTAPLPGPGSANALLRSYELAETAPAGSVKLPGKEGRPVATPQMDAMGLYSPTEQVVMNLPQEKGTAQQMLAQISKAPGSRAAELRATGLDEYLKGKGNAPVTRQEIQDFLKSNPVQVNEVVLGKGMVLSPEAKRRMAEAENRMIEIDNQMAPYFENPQGPDIEPFYRLRGSLARKAAAGDTEAMAEIDALNLPPDIKQLVLDFGKQKNEYMKYSKQARKMVKPQFDNYNIPGGENAREIYLTLPGPTKAGVLPPSVDAQGNVIRSANAPSPLYMPPSVHRVSPEADTNRLAHIFLDDRMDAEGKKVLFVQELQSDWGQEGKKKGFQVRGSSLTEAQDKRLTELTLRDPDSLTPKENRELMDLMALLPLSESERIANESKIPQAPFVTNTEDWLNLALKRVIKEAVDTGAENVAFIKGEQAAKKYRLSTVLDNIEVTPSHPLHTFKGRFVDLKRKDGGILELKVDDKGKVLDVSDSVFFKEFANKPLSDIVGKEMSEKIMAVKPGEESVQFSAADMEVGGQGMKGFYDNILPKTAEKLLKRLGGGKVEPIEVYKNAPSRIPFEADAFLDWMKENYSGVDRADAARAWSMGMDNNQFVKEFYEETKVDQYLGFKITPEMREMVKTQGLPKFAAGGEVTQFIKAHA